MTEHEREITRRLVELNRARARVRYRTNFPDYKTVPTRARAGYSEKTAFATCHENLRKPKIADEIQRLTERHLRIP